jgi:erythronate-4-phosphate dehydrogenase
MKNAASPEHDQDQIRDIIANIYDIQADHRRMQALLTAPPEIRPELFDALRKHYPVRREFHQSTVTLSKGKSRVRQMLGGLGFQNMRDEI